MSATAEITSLCDACQKPTTKRCGDCHVPFCGAECLRSGGHRALCVHLLDEATLIARAQEQLRSSESACRLYTHAKVQLIVFTSSEPVKLWDGLQVTGKWIVTLAEEETTAVQVAAVADGVEVGGGEWLFSRFHKHRFSTWKG